MAILHPEQEATLGYGERLVLQVSGKHARSVVLGADAAGGASIVRRQGSWVVEGSPGTSARVHASSDDGRPMTGRLGITLFIRGGSNGPTYELVDVEVAGRLRVDLLDVTQASDREWRARSLQVTALDVPVSSAPIADGVSPVTSEGPAIHGDPVGLDLAVAFDRSASMRWAFEGPSLEAVVTAVQLARRLALTPASSVRWFTYGSAADPADQPGEIPDTGLTPDELARRLTPTTYSSGARLATVLPSLHDPDLLVAVTDFWPGPDVLSQYVTRSPRLAVLVLGVPPDPDSWPTEWVESERACSQAGVATLPVLEVQSALPRVRDWFLSLFTDQPSAPSPLESPA